MSDKQTSPIKGIHAVLGMDFVSFSILSEEDQLKAMNLLFQAIIQSLLGLGLSEESYRWSPAGDGGYLTFKTTDGCINALDVAFAIWEKLEHPKWSPRGLEKLQLRLAVHSGLVEEGPELGRDSNIWGDGINKTNRILSVCNGSQILISNDYYNSFVKGRREKEGFEFGEVYSRTVKHGEDISIINVTRKGAGLNEKLAKALRWENIGSYWYKVKENYEYLIRDAMNSDDPIAALTAAKFLLNLDQESSKARDLFSVICEDKAVHVEYKKRHHFIFSTMPCEVLEKIVKESNPRFYEKNEFICKEGDNAKSCYFLVYGIIQVDGSTISQPINIFPGNIVGEFSLWIPDLQRTANLKVMEKSLILEIDTSLFQHIIEDYPDLADRIYSTIRHRILENVVNSPDFFPGLNLEQRHSLIKKPSGCNKYSAGTELNLTDSSFILFNGKVRINPPQFMPMEIIANGRFGSDTVIGIPSEQVQIDGNEAIVVEDSVLIQIRLSKILELQKENQLLTRTWDRIWGERHGQLSRLKIK